MTIPYTYLIGWTHLDTYYYGRRTANGCCPHDLWTTYFSSSKYVHEFIGLHGNPDLIEVRKEFNDNSPIADRIQQCILWENKFLERVNAASNPKFLNKSNGDHKFDATGMVSVYDLRSGRYKQVSKTEFDLNRQHYHTATQGKIAVTLISTGEPQQISTTEYSLNRHLYKHASEGILTVMNKETGQKVTISTQEFYLNRNLYVHHSEGRPLTEDHVQKLKDLFTGVPKTNSHKQNISKALTGKTKTQEHINNMVKNRKKPFKPVIVNGLYFGSVTGAAAHFGVNHSAISNFLAGRKKLSARFWEVRYASN